jgi:hypothetical protein
MAYRIELRGTAGSDSARPADWSAAGSGDSLAGALAQAERLVAGSDQAEAVVYDSPADPPGGPAGTEIARYSAAAGWTSEVITPAAWWARLSMPTREKLRADPYGEVPPEAWGEVCEAGGAVLGARPGAEGESGRRLPKGLAGFVESLRPKL